MSAVSLGIMAYNEARGLERLLPALLPLERSACPLDEILVVASGCTDGTEAVVQGFASGDPRVRLLVQTERRGKASAINVFLSRATGEILVLESADTLPGPGSIERLLAPFEDPRVGMTGARPVPVNEKKGFLGTAVHLLWDLHHAISLEAPKMGELVAFRRVLDRIPEDTAVDEAMIEHLVRRAGYAIRYVPEALVWNRGPDTLADLMRQRRRIHAGHLRLTRSHGGRVSTQNPLRILRILARRRPVQKKEWLWIACAVLFEALARTLAVYDVRVRGRNPFIWDIAASTKAWR